MSGLDAGWRFDLYVGVPLLVLGAVFFVALYAAHVERQHRARHASRRARGGERQT